MGEWVGGRPGGPGRGRWITLSFVSWTHSPLHGRWAENKEPHTPNRPHHTADFTVCGVSLQGFGFSDFSSLVFAWRF